MQYSYTLIEAAALWSDIDPSLIRKRMDNSDMAQIEADYAEYCRDYQIGLDIEASHWEQRREDCAACAKEPSCPEYTWKRDQTGAEQSVLLCPHGYKEKPGNTPPLPRSGVPEKPKLVKRHLPHHGEFHDLPDFEQRIGLLQEALDSGHLRGRTESISALDLKDWIAAHFPGEQPVFLFAAVPPAVSVASHPSQERGLGKREQQVRIVVEIAHEFGFDLLRIPNGGKVKLRKECAKKHPKLFTGEESQFNDIWNAALETGRIRMANHDTFARR